MNINRIQKLSLSKTYTKEDIKLSKQFFERAVLELKKTENTKDSKLFYNATELFEKSILTYPKQSESYIAFSFLFWKMEEHENALILLKKAREFDAFNLNITKQSKMINDDYIQKQKDKIIQRHSSKLIEDSSEKKGIISNSLSSIKSAFSIKEEIKSNTEFSKKLSNNNLDFNILNEINSKSENGSIIKENKSIVNSKDSTKNMFESISQLKSQREGIKVKTSTGFLSRLRAI